MKKMLIIFALIFMLPMASVGTPFCCTYVFADNDNAEEKLEQEIKDEVDDQLENLDISGLESLLKNLNSEQKQVFGAKTFYEKLKSIISGEFSDDTENIWQAIIKLVFDELLKFLPLVASIIAVAILSGMLSDMKGGVSAKSVSNITHFVCYGVIVILVVNACTSILNLTASTLSSIKAQIDVAFPVMLTLLTAIGGTTSVGVYQPAVALFSGTIMQIFSMILMPLFIFTLVFSIISNLTSSVKLDRFTSFFTTLFKWLTGAIFTIFIGFLVIQGITAGSFDSVSIRTAKYAIRSYVPILGGYLSEGFNVIMASSVLIKNAIGASGLLLMFASVLIPLVEIVLFMLCLKLTSAILEPLDGRTSNFINSVTKTLIMPIVLIVGAMFMYLIFMGLIMCTGNFI